MRRRINDLRTVDSFLVLGFRAKSRCQRAYGQNPDSKRVRFWLPATYGHCLWARGRMRRVDVPT